MKTITVTRLAAHDIDSIWEFMPRITRKPRIAFLMLWKRPLRGSYRTPGWVMREKTLLIGVTASFLCFLT